MKNKIYLLVLIVGLSQLFACKKDSQKPQTTSNDIGNGLLTFSIDGELLNANIDSVKNVISVVVPRTVTMSSLKINFTLSGQLNAEINNTVISSGSNVNFSKIVYLTVASADKKRSTTFQLNVLTDLQYFGVTGGIVAEKSLNKDYSFYFDQWDGSKYQSINCGPTVTTMALKWADSTSTFKPADARVTIPENGGWWQTGDVQQYLTDHGVNSVVDTLDDLDNVVKTNIDNNNLLVLCLDMFYVPFNDVYYQHIEKFYQTGAPGWGHFLLVKGYKQTQTGFYLEIYDPYSEGKTYNIISVGQLEGKDRYYLTSGIQSATNIWWPYAIVIAPKGKQVSASASRLHVNSISKPVPAAYGR